MSKFKFKSYTLRTESGQLLGKVVLTDEGDFLAITDWGNFNFAWRSHGQEDFRVFIIGLSIEYFAGKIYQGMVYVADGKKIDAACKRFAEKILPALQDAINKELAEEQKIDLPKNTDYPLLLDNIRCALAEYVRSEGCSCCQDVARHKEAANELGALLDIPKYSDNSGYDYSQYYTKR